GSVAVADVGPSPCRAHVEPAGRLPVGDARRVRLAGQALIRAVVVHDQPARRIGAGRAGRTPPERRTLLELHVSLPGGCGCGPPGGGPRRRPSARFATSTPPSGRPCP